jgi:lambda family phage portal protein
VSNRRQRPFLERVARAAREFVPGPVRNTFGRAAREFSGSIPGGSSFKAAQLNRRNADWPGGLRSIDLDLASISTFLRNRARWLELNNPHVVGYRNLLETQVFGEHGITSRAAVKDAKGNLLKDVNDTIDAAFMDWASKPVTLDRSQNLFEFEALTQWNWFRDGEAFPRIVRDAPNPHGLGLQLIDPSMLDERFSRARGSQGREIRLGVEIDEHGAPAGYHFFDRQDEMGVPSGRPRRFVASYDEFTGAGEVIHIFRRRYANQTRGFTNLHAVMEGLNVLEAYGEATLYAARAHATQVGVLESSEDDTPDPNDEDAAKPVRPEELDLEPMQIIRTGSGEKFTPWSPTQPTANYSDYVKTELRRFATGMGGLYFEVANDHEGVNFSSARTGKLTQWDIWRYLQEFHIAHFRRLIWAEWLNMALLKGTLKLPSKDARRYAFAVHHGRGFDYVNPLQEAQAIALMLQLGLTSRTRIAAEHGLVFTEIVNELAAEQTLAASLGVPIAPPASAQADAMQTTLADLAGAGSNGNGRAGLNGHAHTDSTHERRRPAQSRT